MCFMIMYVHVFSSIFPWIYICFHVNQLQLEKCSLSDLSTGEASAGMSSANALCVIIV